MDRGGEPNGHMCMNLYNRVFVRSAMNFVIGDEWFCSIFKLKMGDSSKTV